MQDIQVTKIDDTTAEITITPPAPAPVVATVTVDDLQAQIDAKQAQIDEITNKYQTAITNETAGLQSEIDALQAQLDAVTNAGVVDKATFEAKQISMQPAQQVDITP